jgi:hypothetical protein
MASTTGLLIYSIGGATGADSLTGEGRRAFCFTDDWILPSFLALITEVWNGDFGFGSGTLRTAGGGDSGGVVDRGG